MRRLLLRAVTALAAGLFLVSAVAGPAAAHHPQPAPTPFETSAIGEDLCTLFETAGEAGWPAVHPPQRFALEVTGRAWIGQVPDAEFCLDVVSRERQIEFVGYVNDKPVARHIEPPSVFGSYAGYSFSMVSRTDQPIEYLTVAICHVPEPGAPEWRDRCGDSTIIIRPIR